MELSAILFSFTIWVLVCGMVVVDRLRVNRRLGLLRAKNMLPFNLPLVLHICLRLERGGGHMIVTGHTKTSIAWLINKI